MIGALRFLKQVINGGYNRKISHYHSNSIITPEPDWQDREQQAIIAYHTMIQISMLRISDQPHQFQKQAIANKIIATGLELSNKGIINKGWSLSPKNVEKVWEGFNANIGAKVNLEIYKQDRFIKATRNGRIVLLPTFVTGQIFHRLLSFEKGLEKDVDFLLKYVISGQKGSGKSFSYLSYDYLSQFIISYRMSNGYKLYSDRLFQFVPQSQFKYVKKLLYVPLRQVSTLDELIDHFKPYMKQPQSNQLKEMRLGERIKLILSRFRNYYRNQDIKIICIADQANYYYSCFKEMARNNIKFNKVGKKQNDNEIDYSFTNSLRSLSNILYFLASNVNILVYNSSQSIQAKQITEWNQRSTDKFYDFYVHKQSKTQDLHVGYSQYLNQYQGHAIIYQMFWQNLVFFLQHKQKDKINQKMLILRSFFNKAFGLQIQGKASQQKPLLIWNVDVKYLNIRNAITQQKTNIEILSKMLQNSKENQQAIIKELINLKNAIQITYYQGIKNRFRSYFEKSIDVVESSARFKILCCINQIAYEAMKKKRVKQSNLNASNTENNTIIEEQPIEVDFKKYLNENNLSDDLKRSIQKQLKSFQQLIGIGYKDPKTFKFYFNLEPFLLWKMTLLLHQNFSQLPPLVIELFLQELTNNRYIGNRMDALYYLLFIQNYQFTFTVNNFRDKNKQQYKVKKCVPFQSRNSVPSSLQLINPNNQLQVNFQIQFKILVEEALQNKDHFILGFPIRKKMFSELTLAPNNPFFDFVFLKITNNQVNKPILILHTYDYTVGDISDKLTKLKSRKEVFYHLIQKMKSMKGLKKRKIIHRHFILAPQHQRIQFQKQLASIKNIVQQGNLMKICAYFQNPIYKPEDNDLGLIVGVRQANYFKMGEHISFPQQYKNEENNFFLLMKTVIQSTLNGMNQNMIIYVLLQ